METMNSKLKAQMINGEHCLSLALSNDLILHHFHLGMVTSQKKMTVVPMHCGYVSGTESIVFNISGLIPLQQYISKAGSLELNALLVLLGNTILHLMEYQLNPGNLLLNTDFIYWDGQSQLLKLIYLPLETEQEGTSSQLECTIIEIIQLFQSMKNTAKPNLLNQNEIVKLLIDLRNSKLSIRQMALRLSTLDNYSSSFTDGKSQYDHLGLNANVNNSSCDFGEQAVPPIKIDESTINHSVRVKSFKPKFFSMHKKEMTGHAIIGADQWRFVPLALAVGITMLTGLLIPLAINTKIGIGLISLSIGLYATIKMKRKTSSPMNKESQSSATPIPIIEKSMGFSGVQGPLNPDEVKPEILERFSYQMKEETVQIDSNFKNVYLMLRTEDDPKFIPIQTDLVSIGRNPSICDILLDEAGIGRLHAELHRNGDHIYLKDLHSVNGTFLNGKRIISNQYCELKKGDQIKIGTKELVLT